MTALSVRFPTACASYLVQLSKAKGAILTNHEALSSVRQSLLGHRSAIIWLTGLSAAGKTTVATGVERRLLETGVLAMVLDGDLLRTELCHGLGFSEIDRKENMRRVAHAAILVAEAGAVVVVALISPFRQERGQVAKHCEVRGIQFAEVYVNAPLEICERRDPKQLYFRARHGQIPAFTGISSPYEVPLAPTLELRTDIETVEESVAKVAELAFDLARPHKSAIKKRRLKRGSMPG